MGVKGRQSIGCAGRRCVPLGLVLSALFLGLAAAERAAGEEPDPLRDAQRAGRLGAPLRAAVATGARVRVMVSFALPPTAGSRPIAPGPVRSAVVRGSRESVLAGLTRGAFEPVRVYDQLNAMAGWVDEAGLVELLRSPGVLEVELDPGAHGGLAEARQLTGQDAVQAQGYTGQDITVAVIDSGIDDDHPALLGALVGEACFCSGCCPDGSDTQMGPGSAEDDHGHGTNVTGIVASRGGAAPLGFAPDAEIVAVKVLDSNNETCCASDVVAGLDWILSDRPDVDVVNMSLGSSELFAGECDTTRLFTRAYAQAIDALRARGTAVFVASMNDGSATEIGAPACVSGALAIGAVWDGNVGPQSVLGCTDNPTAADLVTCFTNSNAVLDLVAPGAPMTSTGIGGGTSTFFGTSQATPAAAGCAASLLEADPMLDVDALEAVLESSPTRVVDPKNGLEFPRLDCADALTLVPEPGPTGLAAAVLVVSALRAAASRRRRL